MVYGLDAMFHSVFQVVMPLHCYDSEAFGPKVAPKMGLPIQPICTPEVRPRITYIRFTETLEEGM